MRYTVVIPGPDIVETRNLAPRSEDEIPPPMSRGRNDKDAPLITPSPPQTDSFRVADREGHRMTESNTA